ncbi:uncharacterized protein LOC121711467 [Alosa sapidissima]|uniref:uncharacterized protein LOC121711467 n=1 Tax=Alosa sapidissima TaxID=34773 RepID=UPI001C09C44C|nr:uncharacterized protein LOC121711467 [Alosa sapidissima]
MDTTDEDEDKGKRGRLKTQPAQPTTTGQNAEFLGLMRSFMEEQQSREEGFLSELRETLRPDRAPGVAPEPQRQRGPAIQGLGLPMAAPQQSGGAMEGYDDQPTRSYLLHESSGPSAGGGRADDEDFLPYQPEVLSGPRNPRRASMERGYMHDPKMPVYQQGEDIENYLLRFERIARTWRWPTDEWACRLVPLLTGRALESYSAMEEDQADCYYDLKEALLQKFDISPETYRQRFRETAIPLGETPTETYHRLKGLYRRWIRPEQHSKEDIGEAIILEQLLQVFPGDIRMWVKEHEPEDGQSAAKLAQQYLSARKGAPPHHYSSLPRGTRDGRQAQHWR